jgi:hypothetical protein
MGRPAVEEPGRGAEGARGADGELILIWTLPALVVIWGAGFLLFPGFTHPMSPSMTAAQVAAFYRDPAHLSRIRYSMILFNWFGVGLVPLLTLLVMQLRRMAHQTPILSYCLLCCTGGGPAIFLLANLFWLLAAYQPGRDPQLTLMFNDLAWMTFTVGVPFLIGQSLIIALAIYLDRPGRPVFPRWVAHFNVVVAAALVPAAFTGLALSGPMAWNGLLPFWVKNAAIALWIVVMGVMTGRNIYRERAKGAERPAAEAAVPA